MANRKPIVIVAGIRSEMPAGDTVPLAILPLGVDFDGGARVSGIVNLTLDTYRYKKAINAYQSGGVDSMIAFAMANNSPGSNAVSAIGAILAYSGGDFETLVLSPWLAGSTTATPPGLGLSASSSPTLAATIANIRASALTQAG